jgi:hypothetical protein
MSAKYGPLHDPLAKVQSGPPRLKAAMVEISSAQVSVITGGVLPEYPCERVVDGRLDRNPLFAALNAAPDRFVACRDLGESKGNSLI